MFSGRERGLDDAWRALIAGIERWRQGRSTDPVAASELHGPARALNDVYAGLGLGYYVNASISTDMKTARVRAVLDVYRVTHVARVLAGGKPRRVLELAARGSVERHAAGELDAPLHAPGDPEDAQGLVYVDTVERVSHNFVPFLSGNAPTFPTNYEPGRDPDGRDPRDVIGVAIRRELDAALGAPDDVDAWFDRLRAVMVASCARHEVQHILDWEQVELRPRPARGDRDHRQRRVGALVDAELTAYLSQIANEPAIPHLMLGLQLQYALEEHSHHLGQIAVIMFEGIARHLGIADLPATVHDGSIDRERMIQLAERVMAVDVRHLRAAAAAEWLELYGEPVAMISDVPE